MAEKRKYVPHKKIFNYWKDKCISEDGDVYEEGSYDFSKSIAVVEDWGEPCCWGCGKIIYVENENKYFEWLDKGDLDSIWSCKTLTSSVERAHIIPHSLGGSDTDPSNLFLLCSKCHKESPDINNKSLFLKWVYKKRKSGKTAFPLSMHIVDEALDILENDYSIVDPIIKLDKSYVKETISSHGGCFSDSSIVYAIVDNALKNTPQQLVINFD